MDTAVRLRTNAWWLVAGTLGMLLAALIGPQVAAPALDVRWTGVLALAAIGGITTAAVGPRLLPLAVARGRRLRPLTQGAAVGLVSAAVTAVGVSLFPDVLAPVEIRVGHGFPDLLLSALLWAVPAAGVAGAVLGLAGWAVVAQRDAVRAAVGLVGGAGIASLLAWSAAGANLLASTLTGAALADGSAGAGPVADRAAAVVAAGAGWPLAWASWGLASLGLLAILVLLAERAPPQWRPVAVAVASVAVAADLVAFALLGAALPAVAPAAAEGATGAFLAIEWTALALSGLGGNVVYGVVGLALVRTAGRRLHPLVRLVGLAAFAAAIVSGVGLVAVPHWFGPIVGVSVGLFVAFAVGFGWQLAASRRAQPAAEAVVRRAVRALVPLHPVSFTAQLRHLVAVELACDPSRVAPLLPPGLVPSRRDGRARIILLGAVTRRARVAGLPRALGLPASPTVVLQAEAVDHSGERVATYLRGWADGTFGAAAMHWLTELQLSRVDLQLRATERQWLARGSAGSVRLQLETDPTARGVDDVAPGVAVVARGGRLAEVPVRISGAQSRPARVTALGVPFLDRLGAQVVGAAFLGDAVAATGRARWR